MNNEPAFPNPALGNEGFGAPFDMTGLTKREWFAGMVLPSVIRTCVNDERGPDETYEQMVARKALACADALIAALAAPLPAQEGE